MSSSTKQAIVEAFIKLASKKPLEKITVRNIVDTCGINRNTFYYHFQDIFAVLEEICHLATAHIDRELPFDRMIKQFFLILADYAERHPKAVEHFIASVGQLGAERYFAKSLDEIMLEVFAKHAPDASLSMRRTATVFLRHAVIGLYFDYVSYRGKINKEELAARVGVLANGILASLNA